MLNPCFIYSFIISVILFIVFIPGMIFTIPESYKEHTDTFSKLIVGVVHGSIFIILFKIVFQ